MAHPKQPTCGFNATPADLGDLNCSQTSFRITSGQEQPLAVEVAQRPHLVVAHRWQLLDLACHLGLVAAG